MTDNIIAHTKLMSATPAEFYRSLSALAPDLPIADGQSRFQLPAGPGLAIINFEVLPPRQVTGLLSLPQMEVSISFDGAVSPEDESAFMHEFDLAFRRGGG